MLVTGATGLVGTALTSRLEHEGHRVVRLTRSRSGSAQENWNWDPETGRIDARFGEGMEAVVHLAGENLAAGRWTPRRKTRIRESRVRGTQVLAEAIGHLSVKPRVVIGASATGIYGHQGNAVCTEETPLPVAGFLSAVCREWEAAWQPLTDAGVRVVLLRIGMVLAGTGGALAKMLPIFRLGLGGRLGSGSQYWSWIHLDDLVRVILCALEDGQLEGAFNAVAPDPVTNAEFTRELASVLKRPAWLPVPRWGLRLAVGEMADEVLLSSARVIPERLQRFGFTFRHPTLSEALAGIIHGR